MKTIVLALVLVLAGGSFVPVSAGDDKPCDGGCN